MTKINNKQLYEVYKIYRKSPLIPVFKAEKFLRDLQVSFVVKHEAEVIKVACALLVGEEVTYQKPLALVCELPGVTYKVERLMGNLRVVEVTSDKIEMPQCAYFTEEEADTIIAKYPALTRKELTEEDAPLPLVEGSYGLNPLVRQPNVGLKD